MEDGVTGVLGLVANVRADQLALVQEGGGDFVTILPQ